MKLYLIRHGQSEANIRNHYAGQAQVNLTERGIEEAKSVGKLISDIPFDKVYSSDLYRAMDTQKLALPEADCERLELLREIDVGGLSGKNVSEALSIYGDRLYADRKIYNFKPYGGENFDMLCKRVNTFLDMIKDSGYSNVAAFCHGGVIRTAVEIILGRGIDKYSFSCDNCSVNIFEYKDGKWIVSLLNYTGTV